MSMEFLPGQNRVHGTEMEWPIEVLGTDSDGNPTSEQALPGALSYYIQNYFESITSINAGLSYFLTNGSRFYADSVGKQETTTPEDRSYLGTTASEIANERLLYDVLDSAKHIQASREYQCEPLRNFQINKRVVGEDEKDENIVDEDTERWGYHENYNVPAHITISTQALALYSLHVASRNIFCGAGYLSKTGRYYSSQKAGSIKQELGGDSTKRRPIIHTRQERHSDDTTRRIHNIAGDPSMSPWVTRMQLGTTSIVLDMVADGVQVRELEMPEILDLSRSELIRSLAKDADGTSDSFRLALAIQTKLAELAKRQNLTPEQEWTIEEWERVCGDLRSSPNSAANRVEWLLQRRMLERHQEKHGHTWNSVAMRQHDRRFGRIGPGSIGMALRETVWSEWMPDEELIVRRRTEAPENTRAAIRAKFVRAFGLAQHIDCSVDWSLLKFNGQRIKIDDPYANSSTEVNELIARETKSAADPNLAA